MVSVQFFDVGYRYPSVISVFKIKVTVGNTIGNAYHEV